MAADDVGSCICHAAERFYVSSKICKTSKRFLKEFLAHPDSNGKTLSGLTAPGRATANGRTSPDVLYVVRKWMGFHIIRHYFTMRQYKEASEVVLNFLKFLIEDSALPLAFRKELESALQVAEAGVQQLPSVFRMIKQPCPLNEAWSYAYQLHPFPLAMTPFSAECKETTSRVWPATDEQNLHVWLNFVSERCRVDIDELHSMLKAIPQGLTIQQLHEAHWEVQTVRTDSTVVFKEQGGSKRFAVKFSSKRAADVLPGMLVMATIVELSDGNLFMTDWGYTYPSFYAAVADHKDNFGAIFTPSMVY